MKLVNLIIRLIIYLIIYVCNFFSLGGRPSINSQSFLRIIKPKHNKIAIKNGCQNLIFINYFQYLISSWRGARLQMWRILQRRSQAVGRIELLKMTINNSKQPSISLMLTEEEQLILQKLKKFLKNLASKVEAKLSLKWLQVLGIWIGPWTLMNS